MLELLYNCLCSIFSRWEGHRLYLPLRVRLNDSVSTGLRNLYQYSILSLDTVKWVPDPFTSKGYLCFMKLDLTILFDLLDERTCEKLHFVILEIVLDNVPYGAFILSYARR